MNQRTIKTLFQLLENQLEKVSKENKNDLNALVKFSTEKDEKKYKAQILSMIHYIEIDIKKITDTINSIKSELK